MFGNLGGWSLLIILVVILLLFGAAKLPALAKGLGQSARIFKSEMKAMREENESQANQAEAEEALDADKADSDRKPGSDSSATKKPES